MKRWIGVIGLLFLATAVALYFFIPATENFTYSSSLKCTEEAAGRFLINKNKWQQWWPGKKKEEHLYSYGNCDYRVNKIMLDAADITVYDGKDSARGLLKILPDANDFVKLQWASAVVFSSNPVKKLFQYFGSKYIKTNITGLLDDSRKFFDKEENVYGMKIEMQKVKDSSLIAYKQLLSHYPSTKEIYDMVALVKGYIQKKGGREANYPMVHVQIISRTEYETMVAIPTEGDLPAEENFQLKKMFLGNILMGEVKGGVSSVIKAEQELTNYVNDHKKMSPAIPYQSLVTDRVSEADTSKWITRLYYPVFY